MGRDKEYPLTPELERNLVTLLHSLNIFRAEFKRAMHVTSGYRPGRFNTAAGGAKLSAHETCEACDFQDKERIIAQFTLQHPDVLIRAGLFLEDPRYTPGWIHLQTRAPKSGNRIFIPY